MSRRWSHRSCIKTTTEETPKLSTVASALPNDVSSARDFSTELDAEVDGLIRRIMKYVVANELSTSVGSKASVTSAIILEVRREMYVLYELRAKGR